MPPLLRRLRSRGAYFVLAVTLAAAPAAAQPPPTSAPASPDSQEAADAKHVLPASLAEQVRELEQQLQQLDQQLRILSRRLELEREQAAAKTAAAPVVTAGEQGFQLRSADGAFSTRIRGYAHLDGRAFLGDDAGTGVDTFVARRVRPVFEATTFRIVDVRVMPDFGNGTATLQDAYVDARFSPRASLRVGKFKAPFGLERLSSATELTFIERALPTALAPNRDVGAMVHGDVTGGRLRYEIGLFNGVADGGSADLDDRDAKDVVGRVFVQPFASVADSRWQGLGFGVAASLGSHEGTPAASGLAALRSAGQQVWFRYRGDGTVAGTAVADGDRRRASAQGYLYTGPLGLLAEFVQSSQEVRRADDTATLDNQAWQLAGSWVLTGERASYRTVRPRRNFDPAKGTWGAFELTARANRLTIDRAAFPHFANPAAAARSATGWAAGANWYLNRSLRLTVNFEETHFDGGAAAGSRPTERELLTRIQAAF